MSLVVLNSQGQDPAEWENHFGRGLKFPKNAEICLCGVNLNKWEKEEGANIIQDINDAFIVSWGNASNNGYLPYGGGYLVKLKSGNYTAGELGSALANALAVGNYYTSFADGNFSDIPISPLRLGLLGQYDAANSEMKFTCDRQFIRGEVPVDLTDWLGTCGRESGPNFHTSLGTGMTIAPFGSDDTFVNWRVTEHTRAILNTRALWNGSNGAGILQPASGAMGTAAANRLTPLPEFGYTWGLVLDGTQPFKEVMGFRGGIFRENKQIGVNAASGYNTYTQRMNREDLRTNWAAGGIAYDLYWEIENFTQGGATPNSGSFDFSIYYVPISRSGNVLKKLPKSEHVKVGGGRWTTGTAAAPNWCQVSFRPVDGKGGTDANAPEATVAADRDKSCIDFRYVRGTPLAGIIAGAAVAGVIVPANAGAGINGYVPITDGGAFDLYKGAPLYMGGDWRKFDLTVGNALPAQTMCMKGIYHDVPTTAIASMSGINGNAAYVTAPAVIADMQFAFHNINFAFSPLRESVNAPFTNLDFMTTANRYSNIASAIGFREGQYFTLSSANSTAGLSSNYKNSGWNDKETLCIVQLPNMPIDGELGGGSGNFGGANTAQILGCVGLMSDNEVTGHVYREPFMENWIKMKNLSNFAINQLKVKLTDTTGRKLKCLQPESTIWIKIRECKNDGGIRTGGVNPVSKPERMLDRSYNSFY